MRIAHKNFLFVFLCLLCLSSYAQKCDSIIWSSHRQLKWRDFKGYPDRTSLANAVTEPHIYFHYSAISNLASFRFSCTFSTCNSWAKSAVPHSLLEHEQLHFDLAEYHKRLLVKQIINQRFTSVNLREKVTEIWNLVGKLNKETSALYDMETNHSLNEESQKAWSKKVRKLLKELDEYNKSNYIITLY
jgi:hypothetical protein